MKVAGAGGEGTGVIVMIGKTKITAGVLAAAAVLAVGCGSSTGGQSTQQRPAPAQSTTQPEVTQPAYDTFGFLKAVTGPESDAFAKEQDSLMKALNARDLTASEREARHLVAAADTYLAVLQATNPGPEHQGVKEHLISGVTETRNGAQDAADGIRDVDTAKLQEAIDHMTAGSAEYGQAADELGSLRGS